MSAAKVQAAVMGSTGYAGFELAKLLFVLSVPVVVGDLIHSKEDE